MSAALEKAAAGKIFTENSKPNYGRYRFRIQAHRHREGFHGNFLIAELKVLKSENLQFATPEGASPAPNESATPVGRDVSYTENIDKPKSGGPNRFQTHLSRVFQNNDPLNLGQLRFVLGDKQPGFAIEVDCEVKPKWLEPSGNYKVGTWMKNYHWSVIDDVDGAAIDTARKAAGLAGTLDEVLDELEALAG